MFNVEIGKGSATYTTAKGSVEFGAYSYPFRAYGDPLKDSEGTDDYKDERGVGRTAYLYTCRPDDTGYAAFGGYGAGAQGSGSAWALTVYEMELGGVWYRLDPAAISAIRYRAIYGESILETLNRGYRPRSWRGSCCGCAT